MTEIEKEYICIMEALCYIPDISTVLLINILQYKIKIKITTCI